jgi:hypothetical protein
LEMRSSGDGPEMAGSNVSNVCNVSNAGI